MDFKMDVKILEKTPLRIFSLLYPCRNINCQAWDDSDGLLTEIQLVTTQKYGNINVFVIVDFWMAYNIYARLQLRIS